ncbi:LysR family transcriptional regulator [Pseudomonas fluorescens]|uniref:LysR family transcriptional regulator n=1 Tax=Pseudomonas fluorescens TaxID=294 RepID=UPI001912285E|nr:LysR family transcriptional regulator [Pseudomonas fluorescens]
MDRFTAMHVFVRVVEVQSFRKAAETLSLPPSTITRVIKDLEAHLGIQLLQRTTRRLNLTADGRQYYEHCRHILGELTAFEATIKNAGTVKGKLRIDITSSFARLYILPNIDDFQNKYPGIELTITSSDRTIDLIQEGVDCVIRSGIPQDSTSLVAVQIANFDWVVCGSPSYFEKYGQPQSIKDLEHHCSVGYLMSRTGRTMEWDFLVEGQIQSFRLAERIVVNDTDAYVICGLKGMGLIRAASYIVLPHIQSGRLKQVLSGYGGPSVPLCVMYSQSRHLSQPVRAFIDWAKNIMPSMNSEWVMPDNADD